MPNRYHSNFNGKLSAPMPPKDKGSNPVYSAPESTRAWVKDIGPPGPKRNTVNFPEIKAYVTQRLADDKGLTKKKAKEMLEDGEVHGKPLTKKQRGLFGATASGKAKKNY